MDIMKIIRMLMISFALSILGLYIYKIFDLNINIFKYSAIIALIPVIITAYLEYKEKQMPGENIKIGIWSLLITYNYILMLLTSIN